MRSVNRPLLGWSQSSEHPAFQECGKSHVISGKLLRPQEPELSRRPRAKGIAVFPARGPSLPPTAAAAVLSEQATRLLKNTR